MVKVTPIDRSPKGTSAGDRVVQRNRLLNAVRQFGKAKGTHVGSDQGTVTFTSAHTERYDGVATLPGGTLGCRGDVRLLLGGGIRIPVVGGTGRYTVGDRDAVRRRRARTARSTSTGSRCRATSPEPRSRVSTLLVA